jgi:hypothetical protein
VDPDAERLGSGDHVAWDDDALDELLEEVRAWHRVRANSMLDPHQLLRQVVHGLWGARLDGVGGRLVLTPWIPAGWRKMGLHRLRAHRTLLDLELRPRAEWVTLRIHRVFGPPVALEASLGDSEAITGITIDDTPVGGRRVIFSATGEHEIVFFRSGGEARGDGME